MWTRALHLRVGKDPEQVKGGRHLRLSAGRFFFRSIGCMHCEHDCGIFVTQAGRNQSKDNRYVCIVLSFLVD